MARKRECICDTWGCILCMQRYIRAYYASGKIKPEDNIDSLATNPMKNYNWDRTDVKHRKISSKYVS